MLSNFYIESKMSIRSIFEESGPKVDQSPRWRYHSNGVLKLIVSGKSDSVEQML